MRGSDSNYSAVKRIFQRQPANVHPSIMLDVIDEQWARDTLSDDEVEVTAHEAAVAPLLEEGELDADAIVVSPTGNSASLANNAAERRRREEGWTDLGLDQLDRGNTAPSTEQAAARNWQG